VWHAACATAALTLVCFVKLKATGIAVSVLVATAGVIHEFSSLQGKVEGNTKALEKVNASIDDMSTSMNARIDDMSTSMNARIGDVNARIDDMSTSMSARIGDVNARIGDLSTSMNARIDDQNKRFDSMQGTLDQILAAVLKK